MNKSVLLVLSVAAFLQGCSQKGDGSNAASTYQGKVVLSAFKDTMATTSTLKLDTLSDLPRVVDLKEDMTPVKNQGDRGTCTFFSTMGILEAAIKKDFKVEVNLSEEYLNYVTKKAGHYPKVEGSNVANNVYALAATGVLLEKDAVYQPSWFQKGMKCESFKATDRTAPLECFTHSAPQKEVLDQVISSKGFNFYALSPNTNDIITFLAKERRPLTLSVTVNFNGWPDSGDVYYNEALRTECLNTPSACGGHSVVLTGYDMDKKVFFFKNSWGHTWGKDGYGTITFDSVDNYLDDSLYYYEVSAINIPENYNEIKKAELVSFNPSVVFENDESLKVSIQAEVKKTQGQVVYISSFLAKKYKDETPSTEANTYTVGLNNDESKVVGDSYVRALKYIYTPEAEDSLTWTEESPLVLAVDTNALKTSTSKGIFSSTLYDVYLRSTIYVHDDIDSFKILKRVYHKVK